MKAKKTDTYKFNIQNELPAFRLVQDAPFEGYSIQDREAVRSSKDCVNYVKEAKAYKENAGIFEIFGIIFLNRGNKPIGVFKVGEGGVVGVVADIRKVFAAAICANASAIIAFHNHPSGNRNPSEEDLRLTKRLKEAGLILEIPLMDHIIIADGTDNYFSCADEGRL